MPAPEGNQYALGNNGGRPTKFKPDYIDQVKRLAEKGFTDFEMAEFFGITERTFYRWMIDNEEFCQSAKLGKEAPDNRTERSLFSRANGFEWVEEQAIKLKEISWEDGKRVEKERVEIVKVKRRQPPDTTAGIFWLCNRRKDEWRQRQEYSGPDGGPIEHQHKHDVAFVIIDPAEDQGST